MSESGLTAHSQYAGPSAPEPSPTSPATNSFPSRPNSPDSPLSATDHASYGSTLKNQPALEQTAGLVICAEDVNRVSEGCQNGTGRKTEQRGVLQLLSSNYSPYLMLENSGSVARDHLASERTFLAYVRTSLALASAGVAIVQLFSISSPSDPSDRIKENLLRFALPLGATIVVIGILVLLIGKGAMRYFRIQAALIAGKFPPARLTVVFISSFIALLVSVVFGILVQATR